MANDSAAVQEAGTAVRVTLFSSTVVLRAVGGIAWIVLLFRGSRQSSDGLLSTGESLRPAFCDSLQGIPRGVANHVVRSIRLMRNAAV